MGRKAVAGGLIAAGVGYVIGQGVSFLVAGSTPPGLSYSPATDITIKLIFTGGFGWGAYKVLRESEKEEEPFKKMMREQKSREEFESKIVETYPAVEKVLHPIPAIEKKQDGSYDNKDFIDLIKSKTGGRTSVKPIPGREHYALQDVMTGRFKKWEEYLSKNPKVLEEPPEVQVALFERDVYHEKRDIETIRKKATKDKNTN